MTTEPKTPRARPLAKALEQINDRLTAIEANQIRAKETLFTIRNTVEPRPGFFRRIFWRWL